MGIAQRDIFLDVICDRPKCLTGQELALREKKLQDLQFGERLVLPFPPSLEIAVRQQLCTVPSPEHACFKVPYPVDSCVTPPLRQPMGEFLFDVLITGIQIDDQVPEWCEGRQTVTDAGVDGIVIREIFFLEGRQQPPHIL